MTGRSNLARVYIDASPEGQAGSADALSLRVLPPLLLPRALGRQGSVTGEAAGSLSFALTRPAEAQSLCAAVDSLLSHAYEPVALRMLDAETGMGRSLAAAYFREMAQCRGLPCVCVSALKGDDAVPYGMFARLLTALLGGEHSLLTEETQRRVLGAAVAAHVPEEEEREATVGALKAMLRLAWTGDPPVRPAVLNARLSTAGAQRVAQGLLGARRCCVAVDDAHLADELSWGELELLATHCRGAAFLVTAHSQTPPPPAQRRSFEARQLGPGATFDADQEPAQPSDACLRMRRLEHCQLLGLRPLLPPAFEQLLLGAARQSVVAEARSLYQAAAGSPLWALFLVRFVDDYGLEAYSKAAGDGIVALVQCALARLAPEVSSLAALCSIVGEAFTLALLLELSAPLEKASLLDCVNVLVAKRYLKAVQGRHIGEQTYEFAHPLLRKTIYDRVPMGEAAEGHLRVAEYLEREYKADLRPYFSRLTYHYGKCQGRRTDAFKYTSKAADQAIKRGAYSDGLVSTQVAAKMALSRTEYRILLAYVDRALDDLVSRHAAAVAQGGARDDARLEAYQLLQETLKAGLVEVTRPPPSPAPAPDPPERRDVLDARSFDNESLHEAANPLFRPCCVLC